MINITYIYLVENCFNDPNKVYIGKSKNSREYVHKSKYGKNITYTEIDQINSLNKEDWKWLETLWIQSFISWGFEVMNIKKVGGSGLEYHTKETKQKISKLKKGISVGKGIKKPGSGPKGPRPEWVKEKMRKPKPEGFSEKISGPNPKKAKGKHKPVLQYNQNGEFIKKWNSNSEAEIYFNKKQSDNIGACCRGKQKTAFGYIWKYL